MNNTMKEKLIALISTGKFVSVDFIKKNGEHRTITGRTGVKKHVTGKGLSFDPLAKNLLVIWESNTQNRKNEKDKGYRMISLDRILEIRSGNETITF